MDNGNFRLKRRENPGMYMAGFEVGLETALDSLRKLEEAVPRGVPFNGDFREGISAGLKAAAKGVDKSILSFRRTRELFEASGMPSRPEN
jgi:hypothetical protein